MAYKMLQLILCATVLHMALSYDVDPCTDLKNEMKERAKNRTPQDCMYAGFNYLESTHGCYHATLQNLDRDAAEAHCEFLHPDAHLLVINCGAEQLAVADWLASEEDAAAQAGCTDFSRYNGWGIFFATAGQRRDLTTESPFVWKLPSTEECDFTSEMSYTNWGGIQPDYSNGNQACMAVGAGRNYQWNDYPCSYPVCSVCELDMK